MWSPTDVLVTVRQARSLIIKGKNGTNEAYATIEFCKDKYLTTTDKSETPRWFTQCSFPLPQGGVFHNKIVVHICVLNKRHGKLGLESDDFLGHVTIPLSALNCNDDKERSRWYELSSKKSTSKKERGEIEVAFKFISGDKRRVLPEKKEKSMKIISTGIRSKLRRRSEDEDSGVGISDSDRCSSGMGQGRSCENLSTPYIIDQSPGPFERSFRTSSTNSSPASILSARGSGRVLSSGNLSTKAMSVEVLHRPPAHRSSSGTGDSGTNSSASSPEVKLRSSSMSNIYLPEPPSQSPTNRNESNSAKRHSTTDLGRMKPKPVAPVAALYRPKNYYRLDVKELNKVSTIHEEPDSSLHTMSHKELVKLVSKHKIIMSQKDQHIRELEDYIGSLLVKVMMQAPEILDIQSTHVTKL